MKSNSLTATASAAQGSKASSWRARYVRVVLACLGIFVCALIVRAFHWQDNPVPPFHGMTAEYKAHAMDLVNGDLRGFLQGPNPPSDANVVKHPPGYPLLMAAVYKLSANSDRALRMVHLVLDAISAVLVFFVAWELFSLSIATLSGFLIAVSPQLAYHANALLPDPLATVPLLIGLWLFIRAVKHGRLLTMFSAGLLVGVSCWLRSNALLLPLFLAVIIPFTFARGRRLKYAGALFGGTAMAILPVTIRNYLAFKTFIPLSLSAGITLIVGIGFFDRTNQFGVPATDIGVTQWEAKLYGRQDYLCGRFSPDGVKRERLRVAKGLEIIRAHPFWFAGVMTHRAADMLRLARVELVAPEPAVTQSIDLNNKKPSQSLAPQQIFQANAANQQVSLVETSAVMKQIAAPAVDCGQYLPPVEYDAQQWNANAANAGGSALRFSGPAAAQLIISPVIHINKNTDYVLRFPLRVEQGSVVMELIDAQRKTVLASTPIKHAVNWAELTSDQQPFVMMEKSFVSGNSEQLQIILRNGSRRPDTVIADMGQVELYVLGPSSQTWTRYPRMLIRFVQQTFITAVMLPLMLIGAGSLFFKRPRVVAVLIVLPVYYMCVQSALWTEFRYTLPMYYVLFILAAVGMDFLAQIIRLPGYQKLSAAPPDLKNTS